uniref:Ubiquitin carboxyl-terminal hydrolase n=1 Tax=Lepeophtheirus salmonis TaxID=72036 RepID=A0A0K2SXQ8_LEPSM
MKEGRSLNRIKISEVLGMSALARFGERSKSSVLNLLSKLGKNGTPGSEENNDSSSFLIKEWKRRFESRVPGVMGIRNHGNTCFINAVLQCLSYTEALAEYLVLDNYKHDLKRKKKKKKFSNRRKNVGDGEITEQLATVLKSLWSLEYTPEISVKFKALIEKYGGPQYKGNSQQDAQEFLLWLLDRVHEDLNCSSNKLKRKTPTFISEEEFLAHEALYNYARSNSSFVMDVFQAQFRSSLTCRTCDRVSNTFDPFLCVSLPIPPTKKYVPIYVYVLYLDQTPRHVKIGLIVEENETIGGLKKCLSKDTGIDEDTLFLIELKETAFSPYLKNDVFVRDLDSEADLYCVEIPRSPQLSEEDEGEFIVLSWINILKINDKVKKRFGTPYAIQVSRETLYCDLQKLLLKEMSPILHSNVLVGEQNIPIFKMKVLMDDNNEDESSSKSPSSSSSSYLNPEAELPMCTDIMERATKLGSVIKLVLEWDALAKSQIINDDSAPVEIHSTVAAAEEESYPKEASSVSLQECFSLYTSEEKLGQGDAWFCPECDRKREVVKKMGLWSVPDVLVIHLKRFRQCSLSTDKLLTLIDFPLDGFDMTPNVSRSSSTNSSTCSTILSSQVMVESSINKVIANAFNPWRHPKRYLARSTVLTQEDNYMYDLYAVCNHHGSDLQGGHYTATCRNPTDGIWYSFDDVRTKSLSKNEVVTKDAYILFYQRRTTSSVPPSSYNNNTTSSGGSEHWVYRMPDFNFYKNKSSTLKPTSSTTNFIRNSEKYATLPAKKISEVAAYSTKINNNSNNMDNETTPTLAIPEEDEDDDVSRPIDKNDVD